MNNYIAKELFFGSAVKAVHLLQKYIHLVPESQREACELLNLSRIAFAEKNYSEALRHIRTINPSHSFYYFPIFKIQIIKICILINNEIELRLETENLYRFIFKNKKISVQKQKEYLFFIKYAKYLLKDNFRSMSSYLKKKLLEKLLEKNDFIEKEWMLERYKQLKK